MTTTMSIDDFPMDVRERLDRVVKGDTIIVVDKDQPVAQIRPVPKPRTPDEVAALFASLPHLTPEEAEAFGRDIDEARAAADRLPRRDPWES